MQQLSYQHKLKPWMGFALFAAVMAFMVFVSGYIQKAWELAGLAVTEVFFLVQKAYLSFFYKLKYQYHFPASE